jgi:hypothetical protein
MTYNINLQFDKLKKMSNDFDIRFYNNSYSSSKVFEMIDESGEEINLKAVEGKLKKVNFSETGKLVLNNNFLHICVFTLSNDDKSFILYPQTFKPDETLEITSKRLKNIINELEIFLTDVSNFKFPLGKYDKEYEEFKRKCPKMNDNTSQISFEDIYLNKNADIVSNPTDIQTPQNYLNFYIFIQNTLNTNEIMNCFIKYVIDSYTKKRFRNLSNKVCINKQIKNSELNLDNFNYTNNLLSTKRLIINIVEQNNQSTYTFSFEYNNNIITDETEIVDKMSNLINECNATSQRFLLIQFSIDKTDIKNGQKENYGHANELFFDLRNNRVLRIEPHGFDNTTFYKQKEVDLKIKELFNKVNNKLGANKIFYTNSRINVGKDYKQIIDKNGITIQSNQGMCWVATFMIVIFMIIYPKYTPMTANKILTRNPYENFEIIFFRFFEFLKVIKVNVATNILTNEVNGGYDWSTQRVNFKVDDQIRLLENFPDYFNFFAQEYIQGELGGMFLTKKNVSLLYHKVNSCFTNVRCSELQNLVFFLTMNEFVNSKKNNIEIKIKVLKGKKQDKLKYVLSVNNKKININVSLDLISGDKNLVNCSINGDSIDCGNKENQHIEEKTFDEKSDVYFKSAMKGGTYNRSRKKTFNRNTKKNKSVSKSRHNVKRKRYLRH